MLRNRIQKHLMITVWTITGHFLHILMFLEAPLQLQHLPRARFPERELVAVTGCDSTSSLSGIGKKKAWDALTRCQVHQENLSLLGEQSELSQEVATRCTTFICSLYPSSKKTLTSVNELRYLVFCQRKQKVSFCHQRRTAWGFI